MSQQDGSTPTTWKRASRGSCRAASCKGLAERVRDWQAGIERQAHEADLDVLRLGVDPNQSLTALLEFVSVRRLRKA